MYWTASLCHPFGINAIAIIGDFLVTATDNASIHLWRKRDWTHTRSFAAQKTPVTCLASYGDLLFSGSKDGFVCIWNLSSQEYIARLNHSSPINAIVADNRHLYAGTNDGSLIVWKWANQEIVVEIKSIGAMTSIHVKNQWISEGLLDGKIKV